MNHMHLTPDRHTNDRSGAMNREVAGPRSTTERPSTTVVRAITARRAAVAVAATVATLAGCLAAVTALGLAGAGLFGAAAAAESRTQSGPASDYPAGFRAPFGSLESASDPSVGSPLVAQAGQPSKAAESAAGEDGSGQAESAGALSPEELSTGPVLEWTEIDPGFADLFSFESVDDGRVLARAWGIGDELAMDGERAVYTDNGVDWTELPLPEGIVIRGIDISGDRWLAYGWTHGDYEHGDLVDRVFFTDDRGANWTEVNLDIPPDSIPESSHCDRVLFVRSAAVSEDGIVVDLWGYRVLDAHGLLAERGLVPDGETVLGWRPGVEDTLVFPLEGRGPACNPDGDPSTAGSVPGELVFTPEELGFTDEEWTGLCPDVAPMRLLWSDGSTAQLADGPEDPLVDIFAFDMLVVDNGFAVSAASDVLRVQRVEHGSPASTTATFEGLFPTGMLAAGPAGVAATAFPSLGGQLEASTIGGLPVWRDLDRISEPTGVPLWLGWSADGTDWGWQSLPDAFGITEGEPWAQLAVGRDFVIARVETVIAPTPEELAAARPEHTRASNESLDGEAPPLRWFIARVP